MIIILSENWWKYAGKVGVSNGAVSCFHLWRICPLKSAAPKQISKRTCANCITSTTTIDTSFPPHFQSKSRVICFGNQMEGRWTKSKLVLEPEQWNTFLVQPIFCCWNFPMEKQKRGANPKSIESGPGPFLALGLPTERGTGRLSVAASPALLRPWSTPCWRAWTRQNGFRCCWGEAKRGWWKNTNTRVLLRTPKNKIQIYGKFRRGISR